MTRRDTLECIHEPFGDAFYFGPEFMSRRFDDNPEARETFGPTDKTYLDIVDHIVEQGQKEVRFLLAGRCATDEPCLK